MCDYSMHALATRPAEVGETLITTTFPGTSTRGFASEREPAVAVCMLPGTELAFAEEVKYDNRWIWTRTVDYRVGKFNTIDPHIRDRHHDAIEFPDGSHVLVTQLCAGQYVTVLQLPVSQKDIERAPRRAARRLSRRRRLRRSPTHRLNLACGHPSVPAGGASQKTFSSGACSGLDRRCLREERFASNVKEYLPEAPRG